MSKFQQRVFTVGANDKDASSSYRDRYDQTFHPSEDDVPQPELQLEEHVFLRPDQMCKRIVVEGAAYCSRCGKTDPKVDVACSRAR